MFFRLKVMKRSKLTPANRMLSMKYCVDMYFHYFSRKLASHIRFNYFFISY